jgi:hypothetical protein
MPKVDRIQAEEEFDNWLDFKKIRSSKKESNKDFGEQIIDAICEGDLSIDKDHNLSYKLGVSLEDENGAEKLSKLTFKPRLKVHELNSKLKGVKSDDGDGRIVAYVSAITGQPGGIIRNLDTSDYGICQAIVMYFL